MGNLVQHKVGRSTTSSLNSSPVSSTYVQAGSVETSIQQVFSTSGSVQLVAASWTAPGTTTGNLVAIQLQSTQNITIQTNQSGTIGIQTITISGVPTGGTFILGYQGAITGDIAFNASAATVQTALRALSTIGGTLVTCTGGPFPGSAVTCTFSGSIVARTVPLITSNIAGLTGGAPVITIANGASTPQDVIALTANVPLQWDSSSWFTVPFLGAVTALYVTNTTACVLTGKILTY